MNYHNSITREHLDILTVRNCDGFGLINGNSDVTNCIVDGFSTYCCSYLLG